MLKSLFLNGVDDFVLNVGLKGKLIDVPTNAY